MELKDYLRDEIVEEANLGYISLEEKERRLEAFDRMAVVTGGSTDFEPVLNMVSTGSLGSPELIEGNVVTYRLVAKAGQTEVLNYLAKPHDPGRYMGVLVIHENKGLVPYVEDVARRLAREGFVAMAPDLLSRRGGTGAFSSPEDVTAALATIDRGELVEDLIASVSLLQSDESVDPEKIAVIGFCFGGGMAWRLITKDSRISRAVPFYGPNPPVEDVPAITARVLAIYGGLDDRINAGIPEIEKAMSDNGKIFQKIIYEGAQHAFHNDANPDRYHPEAAEQAWEKAVSWLRG